MKKLLVFFLLVGVALVGIIFWLNRPRHVTINEGIFTYSQVEKGPMIETVSATGVVQIEPNNTVIVSSALPGTVIAVMGKVNDRVAEGTVLLELDSREMRLKWEESQNGLGTAHAALAQAEASLAQAESQEKAAQLGLKYQKDIESNGGFRSEREQAEVKVKAARAGVDAAKAGVKLARTKLEGAEIAGREIKLALDKTKVIVPRLAHVTSAANGSAAGTPAARALLIMECNVKVGQQVGPAGSAPLFILARDLQRLEVHAQVAEGDIGRVRKGLSAGFTVTAFSDENIEFRGHVKEIQPMPSNVKGAIYYDTVIGVDNQKETETGEWRLRPGMTAAVDIIRRQHANVWKVPTAALNFQMEDAYQSAAARAHIDDWKRRPDEKDWKPVWIWDSDKSQPWPVFVRIGGQNKSGEPGLKDGNFNEVLEWEAGHEPASAALPRLIINAPPAHTPGFFDRPANIKLS